MISLFAFGAVSLSLYVSPMGDDGNPGSLSRPFHTLDRAASEVAKERAAGAEGEIRVLLRGGTYYLPQTLLLDARVCGRTGPTVFAAYKKEKPILSGGYRITGWRRESGVYVAALPDQIAHSPSLVFVRTVDLLGLPLLPGDQIPVGDSRPNPTLVPVNQLFVDGIRYSRPRLPEIGYFHVADILDAPDRSKNGDRGMIVEPGQFNPTWTHLNEVETVIFHNWEISRLPIQSAEGETVRFTGPTQSADWGLIKKGARFLVENVKEALRSPGQFYFDSAARQVSLIPLPGQDPNRAEIVAPGLQTILHIEGQPGKPVEDIRFEGIAFEHSAWAMPSTGRTFPQAEADLPGAVFVQHTRNVAFDHCEISHTGGYGLEIADDAHKIRFESGRLTDLGAGGVKIGIMDKKDDAATVTGQVTLKGNLIAGGGRVHPAGVGVWIGQSAEDAIEGNEIADFTYTGVSIGWSWGYAPTNNHDNRIVGNHIHDIGRGVLSDMGGIYHLGLDPGTVISGNRIHDVKSFDYGGWGLYLDEGSTGVTMEDNIVYRCSRQSFHQHYGKDNIIRRNILAFAGEAQLARTRAEDHLSFTLEDNIVYWKGTPLLWGNWDGQVALDHNLFWRTDGLPITFNQRSMADWQKMGRDMHSLFADPLFMNPEKDDFRLKPGSPALVLGFHAMDPGGTPWRTGWKLGEPAFPSQ